MDVDTCKHAIKALMLITVIVGNQISAAPPNPTPDSKERQGFRADKKFRDWHPWVVTLLPSIWRHQAHLLSLVEIYLLLGGLYPAIRAHTLIVDEALNPNSSFEVGLTTVFLVGYALLLVGAFLRWHCYQLLGRNFTFELAIRKGHTLYTRGPYAVVRHPAYTAAYVVIIGNVLCLFGEGSWWATCDLGKTMVGRIFGGIWASTTIFIIIALLTRTHKEDAVLSGTFGEQWYKWSKETPYVLIPYLY